MRRMKIAIPIRSLAFGALCAGYAIAASAQALPSGEQVYAETCAACHAGGVANAPRFGDRKAWAPLIKEGQAVLTSHAWVGIRAMPPRGGRSDLALEAFARAVAHMVRAGGGNWKDPDAAMLERIRAEEARRIAQLKASAKPKP